MLSAGLIITGSIGTFGSSYLLNIKLVNVETGETVNTSSEYFDEIDDILKECKRLVNKLLGTDAAIAEAVPEPLEISVPEDTAEPVPERSPKKLPRDRKSDISVLRQDTVTMKDRVMMRFHWQACPLLEEATNIYLQISILERQDYRRNPSDYIRS